MLNWPNILTGFGTIFMAAIVTATAVIAFYKFRDYLTDRALDRKNKEIEDQNNLGFILRDEFVNDHLKFFEDFAKEEFKGDKYNEDINKRSYRLILFLSKLGRLLKLNKISINEIDVYFSTYLYYKNSIRILIDNLKKFNPGLLIDIKDNLNFLFNEISIKREIDDYLNMIEKEFKNIFTIKVDGVMTFKGETKTNTKK